MGWGGDTSSQSLPLSPRGHRAPRSSSELVPPLFSPTLRPCGCPCERPVRSKSHQNEHRLHFDRMPFQSHCDRLELELGLVLGFRSDETKLGVFSVTATMFGSLLLRAPPGESTTQQFEQNSSVSRPREESRKRANFVWHFLINSYDD